MENRLVTMFNMHWKCKGGEYSVEPYFEGWRLYRSNGSMVLDSSFDSLYILFWKPEYEWFQAMVWKNCYSQECVRGGNNFEMVAVPMCWEDHLKQCAGKSDREIVQYCMNRTVVA